MHDDELLTDLLLGIALGDALGATSEFASPAQIPALYARHFAQGWPFCSVGGGPFNWPAGAHTDDTEMALALVRSFRRCGEVNPGDMAKAFVEWYDTHPRDMGGLTRRVLTRLKQGVPCNAMH